MKSKLTISGVILSILLMVFGGCLYQPGLCSPVQAVVIVWIIRHTRYKMISSAEAYMTNCGKNIFVAGAIILFITVIIIICNFIKKSKKT